MKEITYTPVIRELPDLVNVRSGWLEIPTIIKDIILKFNVKTNTALEFGVEYGYSTSALANYFSKVIGVDTFLGDPHSGVKEDHLNETAELLKEWYNVTLVQSDYKNFIEDNDEIYDLIHIDIVHDYKPTFECGEWSVNHSKITIFHDTESFTEIKKVCTDLSEKYNLKFYNYPFSHGLGILINNDLH